MARIPRREIIDESEVGTYQCVHRWIGTVLNFGRRFHRAASRHENLAAEAARRDKRWLAGSSHSRAAFA